MLETPITSTSDELDYDLTRPLQRARAAQHHHGDIAGGYAPGAARASAIEPVRVAAA